VSRLPASCLVLVALTACGDKAPEEKRDAGNPVIVDAGGDASPARDASSSADAAADANVTSDAGSDAASAAMCPAEAVVPEGCEDLAGVSEGVAQRCDGFDNDCNGFIDEGCPCVDGSVQECFDGPPGRVDTGACRRGLQVCNNGVEFGGWGLCERGIFPTAEVCDRLDNDCNGCIDEREDCDVFIDCPGEGDPRIPAGRPFETYTLDASKFYNGNDVASYAWKVEGSPCDQLFASIPGANATATNGRLSYQLSGAQQKQAQVRFTLSGTYLVSFTIKRKSGQELSCS
jgi:hypothetical protein